jgi:hypothetical protein
MSSLGIQDEGDNGFAGSNGCAPSFSYAILPILSVVSWLVAGT